MQAVAYSQWYCCAPINLQRNAKYWAQLRNDKFVIIIKPQLAWRGVIPSHLVRAQSRTDDHTINLISSSITGHMVDSNHIRTNELATRSVRDIFVLVLANNHTRVEWTNEECNELQWHKVQCLSLVAWLYCTLSDVLSRLLAAAAVSLSFYYTLIKYWHFGASNTPTTKRRTKTTEG